MRFFIQVKEVNDWEKLYDVELENYGFFTTPQDLFGSLIKQNETEFIFDEEGDLDEDELTFLMDDIAEALGRTNCVILADTTSLESDPYDFCYFSLGDTDYDTKEIDGEMYYDVSISDIQNWLKAANIRLTDKRKSHLSQFNTKRFNFIK